MGFEFEVEVPLWIFGFCLLLHRWTRSGFVWMFPWFSLLYVGVKHWSGGWKSPFEYSPFGLLLLLRWTRSPFVECIISFVFLNVWVKHWSWGCKPPLDYLASSFHCSGEPEDLSCLNVTLFCPPRCWCLTLELGLEVPLWIFGLLHLLLRWTRSPFVWVFPWFALLYIGVKHWSWGWKFPFEYLASSSCCSGEPEVPPGVTHLASVTPLALGWKHLYW